MHKEIENYLAQLYPLLSANGVSCNGQREIAYGVQLKLSKISDTASLNVYYSQKNGISTVIGAKDTNSLKNLLQALLSRNILPEKYNPGFHEWDSWIGSDEVGKGDYFGPLVTCAFHYSKTMEKHFATLGVTDSKRLKDAQISKIAKLLYSSYPKCISCFVLKPAKYNALITSFRSQNKNLNDLLAWLHATNIMELGNKSSGVQGILVDRFSPTQKVMRMLAAKKYPTPCIERTGAEADPAVAAASIIARYQLIEAFASMRRFYGVNFPNGATSVVKPVGLDFIKRYGINRLNEVAKLHFKTTDQIKEMLARGTI
jgi:ribonuclease HIII